MTMHFENDFWEMDMKVHAQQNHERKLAEATGARRESTAEPYVGLLHGIVKATLDELHKRLTTRKAAKQSTGVVRLREAKLQTKVIAFIGARTVIDGISQGHSVQALSERIGQRIEDERLFRNFKATEPKLYKWMTRSLTERGSQDYRHMRRVVLSAMGRANEEIATLGWDKKDQAHVGIVVLDALVTSGMLLMTSLGTGRARRPFLRLTPEAEAGLNERNELVTELVRPWFKPTLVPPLDWASPTDGGYHTCDLDLVKTRNRQYLEGLRQAEMPDVYATVNALQRTAWAVNEDVLVVLEELWERDMAVAKLPLGDDLPPPARPDLPPVKDAAGKRNELDEEQTATLKNWKVAKKAYHDAAKQRQSRWSQGNQMKNVARELASREEFYFPHTLDYRGRAYAVPLVLNPQGSDLSRGLLTFAEAKPLGEMGAFWLAVHGANSWGKPVDKGRLEERVDWVIQHEELIRAVAADPLEQEREYRVPGKKDETVTPLAWWCKADAEWQFLAFCLEWAASDCGADEDFESRLPVSIDGSCNGLQHFSAMLRDREGATAVNLTRSLMPQDIYQAVADDVQCRLREDDSRVARAWLAYGTKKGIFDRGLVKRQVMTTPYGVTRTGMLDQLVKLMNQRRDGEFEHLWGACLMLTDMIFDSIGDMVSSAGTVMSYLQGVARLAAEESLPVRWTTPVGFPVHQEIHRTGAFTIDTRLLGRLQLRFAYDKAEIDRRKQVTSVAPNFVHSYDAAHLCRTVVRMEATARRSWAVVHDSFGTHAADVQDLSDTLRATFVEMYEGTEPLVSFAASATTLLPEGTEIPAPPAQGDFELAEVLEAEFFFA
jgi:DNA-directed RNA polymerase